jgi:hypothetical protein
VLAAFEPGAAGHLVRVWNGDPEVLLYLDSCSIELDDHIQLLRRELFGGPPMVRVGDPKEGRVYGFGLELARVLSIELHQ